MEDYRKFINVSDDAAEMLDDISHLTERSFDWIVERLIRCAHESIIDDNAIDMDDPDPADVLFYKEAQDEALADFWLEGAQSRLPKGYRKQKDKEETL